MAEKGSGKRFTHTKGKGKQMTKSSPESLESPPAPIIPHVRCQDNAEQLPKYHAALMRPSSGELPPDDLESIQAELETLLSTVALRYRVLKSELESNDSRRTKYLDRAPISPDKRRRGAAAASTVTSGSGKPRQKFSANSPLTHPPTKMSKLKNSSPVPSQHTDDSSDVSSTNPKHLYHRNDTPNKFWLSIEPFTVPINQEDIRLLDVLLEEYSGTLAPSIPDLGPHYATQWSVEDGNVKEEHSDNTSSNNQQIKGKKSISATNGQQNGDVMRVLRNSKKMGEGITGPFTQRLVSALIEENLINDGHHTTATTTSTENSNSSLENIPNNTNMVHTRSAANLLKNGIAAERRIRKELIEQGILEAKDVSAPSGDRSEDVDEVLTEIQKVRSDLIAIAESNTSQLTTLKEVALSELKRLEIKRKLDDVDHEIVEQNKRVQLAKQKGRSLSKNEREEILRLIEKQRKLSNELENLQIPGYTIPFLT